MRVEPDVFDPSRHFSSGILSRVVRELDLQGRRLLDMGTGTGIVGITAAQRGARVTAVDVNPAAVRIAAANAQEHGVTISMQVLESDLFVRVPRHAAFDWIVFNPPFFSRAAVSAADAAYCAGEHYDTIARFLAKAKPFLAPGGCILLILSSDMRLTELHEMIHAESYCIVKHDTIGHLFENFHLLRLQDDVLR